MVTDRDMAIIRELRRRLDKIVPLQRLILFGSRARGDALPDSDMDVIVIVDDVDEDGTIQDAVSSCAWEVGLENGVLIVPILYSRSDWEQSPERSSLLVMAVEREGVPA